MNEKPKALMIPVVIILFSALAVGVVVSQQKTNLLNYAKTKNPTTSEPTSTALAQNPDKIRICHVPPGNPDNANVIVVSKSAWEQGHEPHSKHNLDFAMAPEDQCPAPPVEPSPTPTPSPTPEPVDI